MTVARGSDADAGGEGRRPLGPRARRRRRAAGPPRTYRLASSIRLPLALGLALLLVLALAIVLLVGRSAGDRLQVPRTILDYHEAVARDGAQSVRRGVNEGVNDLEQLALVLDATEAAQDAATRRVTFRNLRELAEALRRPGGGVGAGLTRVLQSVAAVHGRYQSIYVLAGDRRVIAHAGGEPLPQSLRPSPPFKGPGMQDAQRTSLGIVLIQQYAPLLGRRSSVRIKGRYVPFVGRGQRSLTLVGHYDPRFMGFALESARPGDAWVVNRDGRVIGALGSAPRFTTLPRRALREAARRATGGASGTIVTGGSIDREEVIGFSPVAGPGPAGQFGWSVVTARTVASFALPQTDARRHALLAGFALALTALLVFGWIYIIVLRPLLALQGEAERLVFGDLSRSVQIMRYDEIGLIARALERLRITLIRQRVQSQAQEQAQDTDP